MTSKECGKNFSSPTQFLWLAEFTSSSTIFRKSNENFFEIKKKKQLLYRVACNLRETIFKKKIIQFLEIFAENRVTRIVGHSIHIWIQIRLLRTIIQGFFKKRHFLRFFIIFWKTTKKIFFEKRFQELEVGHQF